MKLYHSFSAFVADHFDWEVLFDQYQREFERRERPFLLCDIFGMNENMHTNLLERLLKYNNYMFLPSFVEKVLGISGLSVDELINTGDVYVTTQLKALGNAKDTWGLVDLTIQIGDTNIIIENKINGAADTRNQLLRYVTTLLFVGISSPYTATGQFDKEWYDKLESHGHIINCVHYPYSLFIGEDDVEKIQNRIENKEAMKARVNPVSPGALENTWRQRIISKNYRTKTASANG